MLGDYVRALAKLLPDDDDARHAVATLCGYRLSQRDRPGSESLPRLRWLDAIPAEPRSPASARARGAGPDAGAATATPSDDLSPTPSEAAVVPSRLEHLGRVRGDRPPWLDQAEVLAEPVRGSAADADPDPLLLPRWTPSILATALAIPAPDGYVDVDRLVESVARAEPVGALPRQLRRSLRAGVQVLVDLSDTMVPFAADQIGLINSIRRLVGDERTEVLRFARLPTRGAGPGARAAWSGYAAPASPRSVVVITDLGLGDPLGATTGAVGEWLAFARAVQRARCPLVAFVPFRPDRVPDRLRRACRILMWDRETTARTAARAVRTARPR